MGDGETVGFPWTLRAVALQCAWGVEHGRRAVPSSQPRLSSVEPLLLQPLQVVVWSVLLLHRPAPLCHQHPFWKIEIV